MQWIRWTREMCLHNRTQDNRRHYRANNRARGVRRMPRVRIFVHGGVKQLEIFRWRCAHGTHPFPSRTRRLRRGRPMVLCWRRHGRVGGCRIYFKDFRNDLRGKNFSSYMIAKAIKNTNLTLKTEY